MNKKMILLSLILVLCTACTRIESNEEYITLIDNVLTTKSNNVNKASTGYKYYLPMGVRLVYDNDYNEQFKIDGVDVYLYVDIVSYYYKNTLNFVDNDTKFYYKDINYNGKVGYITINKKDDEYFLKIVYNYAKFEGYCQKNNIDKIITYGMIILDSIEYNDTLIESLLSDSNMFTTDITYELDKPEDATSKFSQYLEEYVYEEPVQEQLPEE